MIKFLGIVDNGSINVIRYYKDFMFYQFGCIFYNLNFMFLLIQWKSKLEFILIKYIVIYILEVKLFRNCESGRNWLYYLLIIYYGGDIYKFGDFIRYYFRFLSKFKGFRD